MKSTRLHLAKGIKLIQRLLKEQASFFASLWFKGSNASLERAGSRFQTLRWSELVQRVQCALKRWFEIKQKQE